MKSVCEYLIKIPEGVDKKELFDNIKKITTETDNCLILDFESILKKDIPNLGYKEGDQFFVLVGEVHSAFSAVIQTGMEFALANTIAEEMGLPVTNFESIFDDKELDFDLDNDLDL